MRHGASLVVVVVAAFVCGAHGLRALYHAFGARHVHLDRDAYEGDVSDWLLANDSDLLQASAAFVVDGDSDDGSVRLVGNASEHPFAALYMVPARLRLAGIDARDNEYARAHPAAAAHTSLRACATVRTTDRLMAAQANASADCRALRSATFALGGDSGHTRFIVEYEVRLRAATTTTTTTTTMTTTSPRALVLGLIDASGNEPRFAAFGHGISTGGTRALRSFMYFDGDGLECAALVHSNVDNCIAIQPAFSTRLNATLYVPIDATTRWTPWITLRVAFIGDAAAFYVSALALTANDDATYSVVDATPTPWLLVENHKREETNFFPYAASTATSDGRWMPGVGLAIARADDVRVRHFRVLEYDARAMTYTTGPLTALATDDARMPTAAPATSTSATTVPSAPLMTVPVARRDAAPLNVYETLRLVVVSVAALLAAACTTVACVAYARYSSTHARVRKALFATYAQRMSVWHDEEVLDVVTPPTATLAPSLPPSSPQQSQEDTRRYRASSAAASRRGGSTTVSSLSYTQRSMSIDQQHSERGASSDDDIDDDDDDVFQQPPTRTPARAQYGSTSLVHALERVEEAPYAETPSPRRRDENTSSPERLVRDGSNDDDDDDDDDGTPRSLAFDSPRSSSAGGGTMLERRLAELRGNDVRTPRSLDQYDSVVAPPTQRATIHEQHPVYDMTASPIAFT